MGKSIKVSCGTCRHPQDIPVSAIASIEDDELTRGVFLDNALLRLKPRHWIQDPWGDGQWHGVVVASRADVAKLIFKVRRAPNA